ncbi:glycosyltransferase family 2 protein [Mesorhizobium sp. ES1-1]|uniref:glycosyltransferase family 2 protein n=1 Tax=Mesorhizobium sp. ES1-1 TaxID=2876629 RepID=UPI001CCCC221|nr:glycosyltransferase [Mesorhizobium sp. ES1-1]MBZ9678186.1 glycosyltransferase [Mesorhizobium sp. ES1-1]
MSEADNAAAFAGYNAWRRSRLDERMRSSGRQRVWNHLITVVLYEGTVADPETMDRTLSSLQGQTYRNIEIVVTGPCQPTRLDPSEFVGLRGLFVEQGLDPLTILSEPAAGHLWRGSHIVFAAAGTTFDPDAFDLLNRMLSPLQGRPSPDLIVCDHDRIAGTESSPTPCFLPGWDPDLIVAMDYVGTAFMVSRKLILQQRPAKRSASLHEWLCHLANRNPVVGHLAEPVMHLPTSMPRPPAVAASSGHTAARSIAIVIPNRDKPELLRRCVRFLDFIEIAELEVVIVDHASTDPATLALYAELENRHRARILRIDGRFNFSRMVNLGVAASTAEVVILVNNDVEVTDPREVERMAAHAMRPEVGAVGARLLYADHTVQHAGVLLLPGQKQEHPVLAQHVLRGAPDSSDGYLHALRTIRNYQAVTGAIIATRRTVFEQLGGFDEVSLPVECNDIDYCLSARAAGLRVISLPTQGVFHPESSTRGSDTTPEVGRMRGAAMKVMAQRWREAVDHDPFCNPHTDMGDRPNADFPWNR